MTPDEPNARDAYDLIADSWAAGVDERPYNAHYDRPALRSLLPPLAGTRVLDAGCGSGATCEWLVEQGAEVVGLDVSPRLVAHAERRLRGRAVVQVADLEHPLDFAAESFDLVVSGLTFDHVRDWNRLFAEMFRVLREPGFVVFSVLHPFDEFFEHHPDGCYFDLERVTLTFGWTRPRAVRVPHYRRPMSAMLDPLLAAGFRIERVLEPRPRPEFREQEPRDYARLMRQPGFMCIRAAKGTPTF